MAEPQNLADEEDRPWGEARPWGQAELDRALDGWSVYHWKARGGYGNAGGEDAEDNRHREVIWFSPHCLAARQGSLFGEAAHG